jgi:rSAM/selenodomain-associated transferase 1
VRLVVIAKEPRPGRVKTRLCPPCTPTEAAGLAAAALADTLDAVATIDARAHLLALDGTAGAWVPEAFSVIAQRGAGLDERLEHAFADVYAQPDADDPCEPVVLVGMDTPQVRSTHLAAAVDALEDHDAVLGLASDGGFWLLGLRGLRAGAIAGVAMSRHDTGRQQHERLTRCGYDVALVDELTDVDTAAEARAVADLIPGSRFAAAVDAVAALASCG